jgi:RNA polymerase sigma-70 factor (ECF subfamily)
MASPEVERDWILRSRQGDDAAFEALVCEYQKMIHALTFRMTGSLDDAEDLAQDAFLRAYEQLNTFRAESKFSTWLCRIAMNGCLNWRAREGRRYDIHTQWSTDNLHERSGEPEGDQDAELNQHVQAALNRLPAKQRAAVVLTVYEDMSHADAARVLKCTEATVSWRVFAARAKLKKWLKPSSKKR